MTKRHPAAGARLVTGMLTGLAFVGMVGAYQAEESAAQDAAAQRSAVTRVSGADAAQNPTDSTSGGSSDPVAPAPAPAAPAPAPAAPAPAPAAPAPAAPPPAAPVAPVPPVDGTTGGS